MAASAANVHSCWAWQREGLENEMEMVIGLGEMFSSRPQKETLISPSSPGEKDVNPKKEGGIRGSQLCVREVCPVLGLSEDQTQSPAWAVCRQVPIWEGAGERLEDPRRFLKTSSRHK